MFCAIAHKFSITNESRIHKDFSILISSTKISSLKKFQKLIGEGINESMNAFAETFQQHAPVRKLSNKTRKQFRKPWVTSATFKSFKKRQKLFATHFLSNDPNKVKHYKKYNNKLNK